MDSIRNSVLRDILRDTRECWDHSGTRPTVRKNFIKMIQCGTPALGTEKYASATEQKLVHHTCKSRTCPSCGYRSMLLWQREQWAALPDISYSGIVLTMPDVLWPIFNQNRQLLHDLPALGAAVLEQWAKLKYGIRLLIMIVPHTFGSYLNFNCHLHILVSAGGLREAEARWRPAIKFEKKALMRMWKYAVIEYLRAALRAGLIKSRWNEKELRRMFKGQYERPFWNIQISRSMSKKHFLSYAARYARRAPIAQNRILSVTDGTVEFRTKDKRENRWVTRQIPNTEFVAILGQHILDHYQHAIRYFGLLAPRSKHQTSAAIFALIGQKKRSRPKRLPWRESLLKYFKTDPLRGKDGQVMHWVSRRKLLRGESLLG